MSHSSPRISPTEASSLLARSESSTPWRSVYPERPGRSGVRAELLLFMMLLAPRRCR